MKIKFEIDGKITECEVNEGDTIIDIKHNTGDLLESLECACEGSLACSTCHVIVDKESFDYCLMDKEISDDESDMLDLAHGVTKTSRLGCQIKMNEKLNGAIFKIPSENRNFSAKKIDNSNN